MRSAFSSGGQAFPVQPQQTAQDQTQQLSPTQVTNPADPQSQSSELAALEQAILAAEQHQAPPVAASPPPSPTTPFQPPTQQPAQSQQLTVEPPMQPKPEISQVPEPLPPSQPVAPQTQQYQPPVQAQATAAPLQYLAPQPQAQAPNPASQQLLNNLAVPQNQVINQALPQAMTAYADQAEQQWYQQHGASSSNKEALAGGGANPIEAGLSETGDMQYVETEKNPELPVEVEGYLEHVQDHAQQHPKEIVLADQNSEPLATKYPKQSVVVLPITPDEEKEGARKGVQFSFRWLVEWSRRLMKMFSGSVVYRPVEES